METDPNCRSCATFVDPLQIHNCSDMKRRAHHGQCGLDNFINVIQVHIEFIQLSSLNCDEETENLFYTTPECDL